MLGEKCLICRRSVSWEPYCRLPFVLLMFQIKELIWEATYNEAQRTAINQLFTELKSSLQSCKCVPYSQVNIVLFYDEILRSCPFYCFMEWICMTLRIGIIMGKMIFSDTISNTQTEAFRKGQEIFPDRFHASHRRLHLRIILWRHSSLLGDQCRCQSCHTKGASIRHTHLSLWWLSISPP